MARQIDIIANADGSHYLVFGIDSNSLSSFRIQMWITKYGQRAVDWVQSLSLGWLSFMGGDVYVQNSDAVPRVNFFGEQKYTEVGIVANQEPTDVKLLDSIGIQSDGKWSVESVTIPASLNHPSGMESRIPKERFHKREGLWWSEFLRNGKTSSSTLKINEIISGEPLRGTSAYIVLRNIDTSQIKMFEVKVSMSSSRGSV